MWQLSKDECYEPYKERESREQRRCLEHVQEGQNSLVWEVHTQT